MQARCMELCSFEPAVRNGQLNLPITSSYARYVSALFLLPQHFLKVFWAVIFVYICETSGGKTEFWS